MDSYVSLFLCALIIAREYLFYKEINKLTDKIISRDFTEYSSGVVAMEESRNPAKKEDISSMVRI